MKVTHRHRKTAARRCTIQTSAAILPGGVLSMRRGSPTPSEIYDTYWRFAAERQGMFFRRLENKSAPWTDDAVLQQHRFTNAYRASDRVSQYLIRHVIYGSTFSAKDTLFRLLVFKIFNRIETWELLEHALGTIRWKDYSFGEFDRVLSDAIDRDRRIYSAAYIMPACAAFGNGRKHRGHLKLIERIITDDVADRLNSAQRMSDVFLLLRSYPSLGPFLAYQYTIDLNYTTLTNFAESEFVVPGPGARDGLRKVFRDPGGYTEADLIRWMADRQEVEFARLGLSFRGLWGRRLQLIDCQNLCCEVDKYARVHHPDVAGLSGRTRIKQKYKMSGRLPTPWYPPKWGLNDDIARACQSCGKLKYDHALCAA